MQCFRVWRNDALAAAVGRVVGGVDVVVVLLVTRFGGARRIRFGASLVVHPVRKERRY